MPIFTVFTCVLDSRFPILFVQMLQALPVRLVEALQLFGRAGVSDELVAGEQGGRLAELEEPFGGAAADHVHDHAAGDGRGGAGAPLEALELDDAVAGGALVVDDEVGDVEELLARGVAGGGLAAVGGGADA